MILILDGSPSTTTSTTGQLLMVRVVLHSHLLVVLLLMGSRGQHCEVISTRETHREWLWLGPSTSTSTSLESLLLVLQRQNLAPGPARQQALHGLAGGNEIIGRHVVEELAAGIQPQAEETLLAHPLFARRRPRHRSRVWSLRACARRRSGAAPRRRGTPEGRCPSRRRSRRPSASRPAWGPRLRPVARRPSAPGPAQTPRRSAS